MQLTSEMDLSLQVSGNFLGALFIVQHDTPELVAWNWKTSKRHSSREIATFVLLTSHLLLVGTVMNEATEVTEPRLFVLDTSKSSTIKLTLTSDYICVFGFPPFDLAVSPVKIVIRSDRSPERKPDPEAGTPFSIARGQRLFLITTWVEEKNKKQVSYDLFAPANILLSYVPALPPRTGRHAINWDAWGPTGTCFLKSPPHSDVWTRYVFGSKFVSLVRSPKASQGATALGFEKDNVRHVNDTTVVEDKVSLPYSITTGTLPPPGSLGQATFTDAMRGEDTICLIKGSHPNLIRHPSPTAFFYCSLTATAIVFGF
ncbi:hypothetical protein EV702DRAFT_1151460 [Suillus placidus]|uniref:Uncharacterized protein n=1 Tax=Suillus placidus TaxID=48579 RepID=A0A9P6ZH08_9AGAM|nr:hypothetical protein EV702DRAFT_1151460 [Suillus placidus]